jgi:predicted enzyme related to lactoylglutathione lyase
MSKIIHIELPANDAARARAFWGGLNGYEFHAFGGQEDYQLFQGEPGGAVYTSDTAGQGPLVYFGSTDLDADVARVRSLGGVAADKQPVPGVGWYAHCTDTEGNRFGLFQGDESAAPPS